MDDPKDIEEFALEELDEVAGGCRGGGRQSTYFNCSCGNQGSGGNDMMMMMMMMQMFNQDPRSRRRR